MAHFLKEVCSKLGVTLKHQAQHDLSQLNALSQTHKHHQKLLLTLSFRGNAPETTVTAMLTP